MPIFNKTLNWIGAQRVNDNDLKSLGGTGVVGLACDPYGRLLTIGAPDHARVWDGGQYSKCISMVEVVSAGGVGVFRDLEYMSLSNMGPDPASITVKHTTGSGEVALHNFVLNSLNSGNNNWTQHWNPPLAARSDQLGWHIQCDDSANIIGHSTSWTNRSG